ncbi:hypothetical protein DOY81_007894 [Sarcophaga bullata]|nr:hypothetical protein DOY81_007894 [Sarcophaga bullata]
MAIVCIFSSLSVTKSQQEYYGKLEEQQRLDPKNYADKSDICYQ